MKKQKYWWLEKIDFDRFGFMLILLLAVTIGFGFGFGILGDRDYDIKELVEDVDNAEKENKIITWQDKQYMIFRYRGTCDLVHDDIQISITRCEEARGS